MTKADWEYRWRELGPGCIITEPGNSRQFQTGDWRAYYPLLKEGRCLKCGICWISCPDAAYWPDPEGYYRAELAYCKGCGICARECPTGAITMEREREL